MRRQRIDLRGWGDFGGLAFRASYGQLWLWVNVDSAPIRDPSSEGGGAGASPLLKHSVQALEPIVPPQDHELARKGIHFWAWIWIGEVPQEPKVKAARLFLAFAVRALPFA